MGRQAAAAWGDGVGWRLCPRLQKAPDTIPNPLVGGNQDPVHISQMIYQWFQKCYVTYKRGQ